jgi:hypothetical protein
MFLVEQERVMDGVHATLLSATRTHTATATMAMALGVAPDGCGGGGGGGPLANNRRRLDALCGLMLQADRCKRTCAASHEACPA